MNWYTEAPLSRRDLATKITGINGVTALWAGSSAGYAAEVEANGLDPAVTYAINPGLHSLGVSGLTQRWVARGALGSDDATVSSWPSALSTGGALVKDGRPTPPVIAHQGGVRVVRTPTTLDSGYGYPIFSGPDSGAGAFTALVIARMNGSGGSIFAHRGINLGAVSPTVVAAQVAPGGSGGGVVTPTQVTVGSVSDFNAYIVTSDGAGAVSLKTGSAAPVVGSVNPSSATITKLDCMKDYVEVAIWPTMLSSTQRDAVYTAALAAYPWLP